MAVYWQSELLFRILWTIPVLWIFSQLQPFGRFHLARSYFFFSRRILEENEPDYYSGKFFFLFFFVRPQNVCVVDTFYRTTKSTAPASGIISELLQRVPPFVYSIFNVRYKTGRNYRVPPLNFFRHCATFFSKFF